MYQAELYQAYATPMVTFTLGTTRDYWTIHENLSLLCCWSFWMWVRFKYSERQIPAPFYLCGRALGKRNGFMDARALSPKLVFLHIISFCALCRRWRSISIYWVDVFRKSFPFHMFYYMWLPTTYHRPRNIWFYPRDTTWPGPWQFRCVFHCVVEYVGCLQMATSYFWSFTPATCYYLIRRFRGTCNASFRLSFLHYPSVGIWNPFSTVIIQ